MLQCSSRPREMAISGHSRISTMVELWIEDSMAEISARVPGKSLAPGVSGIAIMRQRGWSPGGSVGV